MAAGKWSLITRTGHGCWRRNKRAKTEKNTAAGTDLGRRFMDLSRFCAAPGARLNAPCVRKRRGFSSPKLNGDVADNNTRLGSEEKSERFPDTLTKGDKSTSMVKTAHVCLGVGWATRKICQPQKWRQNPFDGPVIKTLPSNHLSILLQLFNCTKVEASCL